MQSYAELTLFYAICRTTAEPCSQCGDIRRPDGPDPFPSGLPRKPFVAAPRRTGIPTGAPAGQVCFISSLRFPGAMVDSAPELALLRGSHLAVHWHKISSKIIFAFNPLWR